MTVNTITRAFSDPSNLIQKAKQKTSPFIYGIKNSFIT